MKLLFFYQFSDDSNDDNYDYDYDDYDNDFIVFDILQEACSYPYMW